MLFKDYIKTKHICANRIGQIYVDGIYDSLGWYRYMNPRLKTIVRNSEVVDVNYDKHPLYNFYHIKVKIPGVSTIKTETSTVIRYNNGKVSRFKH